MYFSGNSFQYFGSSLQSNSLYFYHIFSFYFELFFFTFFNQFKEKTVKAERQYAGNFMK